MEYVFLVFVFLIKIRILQFFYELCLVVQSSLCYTTTNIKRSLFQSQRVERIGVKQSGLSHRGEW